MKHTIEIDLPDGWEPGGEPVLGNVGPFTTRAAIWLPVRPAWQWPEWLTAKWIVQMQHTGKWIGSTNEPLMEDGRFQGWFANGDTIDLSLTTFVPPHCTDWRQSKRRNPRSKQP